jgi:CO/xanthine dehydrogenase FAD-binding subunit
MSGISQMQVQLSEVERALEGKPFTDEILVGGLEGLADRLVPPDDFRGSVTYRRAVAPVIARRALMEAWGMAAG